HYVVGGPVKLDGAFVTERGREGAPVDAAEDLSEVPRPGKVAVLLGGVVITTGRPMRLEDVDMSGVDARDGDRDRDEVTNDGPMSIALRGQAIRRIRQRLLFEEDEPGVGPTRWSKPLQIFHEARVTGRPHVGPGGLA